MCGRAEHTMTCGLDMGSESKEAGINAILEWDMRGEFKIILDRPGGTGSMRPRAGA